MPAVGRRAKRGTKPEAERTVLVPSGSEFRRNAEVFSRGLDWRFDREGVVRKRSHGACLGKHRKANEFGVGHSLKMAMNHFRRDRYRGKSEVAAVRIIEGDEDQAWAGLQVSRAGMEHHNGYPTMAIANAKLQLDDGIVSGATVPSTVNDTRSSGVAIGRI